MPVNEDTLPGLDYAVLQIDKWEYKELLLKVKADAVSLANCTEKLVLATGVLIKYPLSTKSEFAGAEPHRHSWGTVQFTPPSLLCLRLTTLLLVIATLALSLPENTYMPTSGQTIRNPGALTNYIDARTGSLIPGEVHGRVCGHAAAAEDRSQVGWIEQGGAVQSYVGRLDG